MKKGNQIFIGIIAVGFILGVILMFTNEKLFNQIVGDPSAPVTTDTQTSTVIAGTTTPYLAFSKSSYDKALKEKKIVLLNFYAGWCPICRAEAPDAKAAFDSLNNPDAIGFQVNYNDDQTDADEKALAKQYAVPYQHTKVVLKNGKQILKKTAQWNKQQFIEAINNAR